MPILKRIFKSKVFIIISAFLGIGIIFVVGFNATCSSLSLKFIPVQEELPQQQKDAIAEYVRAEESTYLTFPEWYLVFDPQEYGQFLEKNPPSGYPYFFSIGQFWSSYCKVYGITKQHYPFNAGNHLMLSVIGTSFTAEYLVKGMYENTIGRLTELLSSNEQTEEDKYAALVAQEYGNFIPTTPWYEFPYGKKFVGVWKTSLWGDHILRKWERKIFLSLEYGVKTIYALVIKGVTRTIYGVADTEVYAIAEKITEGVFDNSRVRKIEDLGAGSYLITVPHYQGFTDVVPELARQGVQFISFAGNNEILLTAIAPREFTYNFNDGILLFEQKLMITQESKRIAVQVPVKSLTNILNSLWAKNVKVEHLFDY